MKFLYQARTKEGDIKSGIIEASSKEVALSLLQKLNLYVTYLEEEKSKVLAQEITIFQRITLVDLLLFSRQLSILLKSKISIIDALTTISNQTKNKKFREILLDIVKEVEGGSPLSKAISKYPDVFSQFYVAMIKAGEISGKISEYFHYLAEYLERQHTFKSKITGALIYPVLVLIVFCAVFSFMMISILPSFETILLESGAEVPLITKMTLSFSKFFRENFFVITFLVLLSITLLIVYGRTKEGKKFFDKISLKLPFFGKIIQLSLLSRVSENLSTLTFAGIMITESLEIIEEIVGNEIYKHSISKINEGVKKGEKISSILLLYPELFPPLFTQLVMVGEKTGTLSSSFLIISDFYRKEVERLIDGFLKILEPLLILILGGLVGGLMFAVFLPIYNIMNL